MLSRDSKSPSSPSSPPQPPLTDTSGQTSIKSFASLTRPSSVTSSKPVNSKVAAAFSTSRPNTPSPTHTQPSNSSSSSRSNSISRKRVPSLDSSLSILLNIPKVSSSAGSTSAVSNATALGLFKQPPVPHHTSNFSSQADASLRKEKSSISPLGTHSSTPSNDSDASFPVPESYHPATITTSNRNRLPLNQLRTIDRSLDRTLPAYASDSQISTAHLDEPRHSLNDDSGSEGSSGQDNEDIKFATSKNENLVLELSIDGLVRHLSSNWEDIVGYV